MKKTLSVLLTAASVVSMFWMNVSPDLKSLCASNVRFGGINHTDSGNNLVLRAKVNECQVTAYQFPN